MPAYKKQHFLPTSYLKFFSEDQAVCNPQSCVWRYDGDEVRLVPVRSQCFGDYFYSKENAQEVEQMFQRRETIYSQFVEKIRASQESERKSYGDLFLCMADIFLRNGIHKNLTTREGLEAYDLRLNLFFSVMLLEKQTESFTKESIKAHLESHWRMEIISAPADFKFATSDNPSLFTTCRMPSPNRRAPLQLILLPLDPAHIAIAFDKRFMYVQNKPATALDVRTLNYNQIMSAECCVYKSSQFTGEELVILREVFSQKSNAVSEVTPEGWRSYLHYLPLEHHFSFMQMKPLLL
jgi:hypothetical protein